FITYLREWPSPSFAPFFYRTPFSCLPSLSFYLFFFFQSPAAPRVLPSFPTRRSSDLAAGYATLPLGASAGELAITIAAIAAAARSEEHTSELQSLTNLVCRLLLEKKKKNTSSRRRRNGHHHNSVRRH